MGKFDSSSLEPGAYFLRAQNQSRAFEPKPRLIPPLVFRSVSQNEKLYIHTFLFSCMCHFVGKFVETHSWKLFLEEISQAALRFVRTCYKKATPPMRLLICTFSCHKAAIHQSQFRGVLNNLEVLLIINCRVCFIRCRSESLVFA